MANSYKNTLPYLIIAVLVVVCVGLLGYRSSKTSHYSPEILKVTQPVNTIAGIITDVGTDRLTVRLENINRFADETAPTLSPENQVVYTVRFTDKTVVTARSDALFLTPGMPPFNTATLRSSLARNMLVMITTKEDLRVLDQNEFDADTIMPAVSQRVLVGTVTGIGNDELQVRVQNMGVVPVKIISATDYYETDNTNSTKSISRNDLKVNQDVSVFVLNTNTPNVPNDALRIIVMPPAQTSAPVIETNPPPEKNRP